ncbi:hypothetical protein ABT390_37665 [Streptomyces aurantiacus]|uniref:Glycosyltransferase RgtA/B/C/D-like domain-containing protein n=1 Tax=Streptomyces aurantiacus JA 4570 TaxID=1286094 RepID=S3ZMV3_9ACTN|nr:hypothetical protein [Streptomyces aurantiacus]EPH44881.1 hypothetical protein STRAU_2066 [Streptomyces aurantiacus JA 4570]
MAVVEKWKPQSSRPARRDRERAAHRLLVAACALFALASLALVPLDLRLGWDELVYASRFGPYAPDQAPGVPFSAPRTRGVPVLLAPVASWSDSVVLLRVWLTALSTAALYLGFRPWLRAVPRLPEVAGVAAALYGSLWFALFYANAAMPNHYTAMGAAGAVGLFLHRRPGPRTYAGIAAGLLLATLMRPNDGAAVAAPLLAAAALVPLWRSRGRALAVLGGLGAGLLPWVIEAYVRFGGVRERLDDASEVQGGLRFTDTALHQLTAIDGPLLCRPCAGDGVRVPALGWWVLLAVFVPAGLWSVRRFRRTAAGGRLAAAVGVCAALPYVVVVPYTAPRFLLPTHALLAVPAAMGVLAAVRWARGARVPVLAGGVLAAVLVGHLAVQGSLVSSNSRIQSAAREDWERVARVVHREGVRPPCLLGGNTSVIPLAYAAGCEPAPRGKERRGDERRPDVLVLRRHALPGWAQDWHGVRVPDTYSRGWRVYVPAAP